jgi:hypothetical protein
LLTSERQGLEGAPHTCCAERNPPFPVGCRAARFSTVTAAAATKVLVITKLDSTWVCGVPRADYHTTGRQGGLDLLCTTFGIISTGSGVLIDVPVYHCFMGHQGVSKVMCMNNSKSEFQTHVRLKNWSQRRQDTMCINFIVQLATLMHVLFGQSVVFPCFTFGRIINNQFSFWLFLG